MNTIIDFLSSNKVVSFSGFLGGLIWFSIKKNDNNISNIIAFPLTTLFIGSYFGALYATGSEIVSTTLPKPLRVVIPISISASILYAIIKAK